MEFKKPTKYTGGRAQLSVPQRADRAHTNTAAGAVHEKPAPQPNDSQPTPKKPNNNSIGIHTLAKRLPSTTAVISFFETWSLAKKTVLLGVVVIVVGLLANHALHQNSDDTVAKSTGPTAGTPTYPTVLPTGKSIDNLGGWKRVSPSKNDPVFAYVDAIDGIPISVSQQPLPTSFGTDANGQVAELAKKFNATDKISATTTTIYIGTSAKGPQSTIFTKKNLLILIKSQKKIDDKSWSKYVDSLG